MIFSEPFAFTTTVPTTLSCSVCASLSQSSQAPSTMLPKGNTGRPADEASHEHHAGADRAAVCPDHAQPHDRLARVLPLRRDDEPPDDPPDDEGDDEAQCVDEPRQQALPAARHRNCTLAVQLERPAALTEQAIAYQRMASNAIAGGGRLHGLPPSRVSGCGNYTPRKAAQQRRLAREIRGVSRTVQMRRFLGKAIDWAPGRA